MEPSANQLISSLIPPLSHALTNWSPNSSHHGAKLWSIDLLIHPTIEPWSHQLISLFIPSWSHALTNWSLHSTHQYPRSHPQKQFLAKWNQLFWNVKNRRPKRFPPTAVIKTRQTSSATVLLFKSLCVSWAWFFEHRMNTSHLNYILHTILMWCNFNGMKVCKWVEMCLMGCTHTIKRLQNHKSTNGICFIPLTSH